jgi:hypothetical protein
MEHYKTNIPLPTKKQMAKQKGIRHTMGYDDVFHKVVCVFFNLMLVINT